MFSIAFFIFAYLLNVRSHILFVLFYTHTHTHTHTNSMQTNFLLKQSANVAAHLVRGKLLSGSDTTHTISGHWDDQLILEPVGAAAGSQEVSGGGGMGCMRELD